MSENRLRKSCRKIYINPIEVEKRLAIRKAVILADSKGKYIEREVITGHCLKVKSIWKKGWKIQDYINWAKNNLTTVFDATEKYTFYIWLGTCDITHLDKKTRLISFESEDSTNVWYIIGKFNELKEIIVSKIARADVVFLEVPSISIQHWNYSQGHTNYKDYQDLEYLTRKSEKLTAVVTDHQGLCRICGEVLKDITQEAILRHTLICLYWKETVSILKRSWQDSG